MARTPEQDAVRAAKKPNMRAPGAQAFGMMADAVTPPDVPAGVRAFDSMAKAVTPPPAGGPVAVMPPPEPPNFTMGGGRPPPGGVPPVYRSAAGLPPPTPGTDLMDPKRQNWTTPGGPEVLGTGPAAVRNNAGAVDALIKPPVAAKPTLAMRAEPIIHGLAPGIAGALTAGAVDDGRQKEAEAQYAKTVAAAQPYTAKPGEIPKAIDGTVPQAGPAPVAGSFLNQSEAGRNVGNAMMALPGGGLGIKAAQTALTALPIAARGIRAAQTAVPATVAAAQGFAGGDANFPGRSTAPVAPGGQLPQASYSNEGNNYSTPEKVQTLRPPPFDPAGKIIKTVGADGKVSYSGDNVKFGGDIYSPDGKVVNGGDPKNPKGFGVSSLDTSEGHRQNLLELQRLQAERQQREAGFAGNQPGGGLGGFGGGTISSGLRESHNRQSTAMSTNTVGQRSQRQQDALDMQKAQLAQSRETAQMQNATTQAGQVQGMRVAEMNNDTQRYGADLGARTARENNQMHRENNQLQREIAMGQREYQRRKDTIELGMKERDFQTNAEKTSFEQKAAREKDLQTKIEQRFTSNHPVTGNPQVDANQVRVFRENMDRAVARLGADGVHKLSPKDEEKLFAATSLLQKVQASAGPLAPWKPDFLRTVDAVDLTNLQQDPKTGEFVINSDNPKVHGQVIPKRFLSTEEAHFFTLGGMRGTPTNRFDMLTNGARQ